MNAGEVIGAPLIDSRGLPAAPLDAAAAFHARIAPQVRTAMARQPELVVVFDRADHTHAGWRLAAVQELAREAAPGRVNAIAAPADAADAVAETVRFLAAVPGISGQVLEVDSNPRKSD